MKDLRVENDVRITIRLIDARTDTNLWAESFDRDMSNILRLQQEAARAIAEKINVALTPAEESRLAGAPQVRPEAYEAYLKGMFHWYKLTPQDLQSALQCFDAALAADPDYAPAYAGIAAAWAGVQQMGAERPAVAGPKIKSAVDKALELDANLSQAHFTSGVYYTWTAWDWAKAESSFQRAIELNPNFPDAYAYYSHYLNITGRFDEAETQVERALDLDPFNPLVRALYACDLMFWERYDEAIEQLQSVLNVAPDHWLAFQAIRFPYHYRNMYNDALGATRSLYITLGNSTVVEALDRGSAEGGYQVALARAGDALAKQAETTFVLPTQIAILYGMADEVDRTAIWIEKAYEAGDPELPYLKYLRRFPPSVMDDPRVKEIVTRMNYPPKL
ncbi:MAG: tetratricopeptide repeat protein [Proteobacteria bacterium]|nr:tetratricopeptide repeat protein [Pseudomonadota bacterium]